MDGESTAVPSVRNLFIRTLSTFCLQYILCVFIPVPYMTVGFHRGQFRRTDVEGAYYAVSTLY